MYTPPQDPQERFEEAQTLARRLRKCLRYIGNDGHPSQDGFARRSYQAEMKAEEVGSLLAKAAAFREGQQAARAADAPTVVIDQAFPPHADSAGSGVGA